MRSMSFPEDGVNEGLVQAWLDDELAPDDAGRVQQLVATDPAWAAVHAELEQGALVLGRALATADVPPRSTRAPAWIRVLSGKGRTAASSDRPWARAAAVVLLAGGVLATGLPGSPVRAWLGEAFAPAVEAPELATTPTLAAAPDESAEVGVRVDVPGSTLDVRIGALAAGEGLTVDWTGSGEPAVFAAPDTRFRTEDGRVEVLGEARGVRVEVPSSLTRVTITVAGRVYLRKDSNALQVSGPVLERTDDQIRFAPAR